eukprot:CAMPEP_0172447858 /NCGR_PEP_ID=MMETSP1065-20121228/7035_1 /TAXON_ID=265537 /ORGANISM="Amphiprora paludosa, Strain CCMP125" /LENGTH=644 /DNA_ID=CAMNT_0013199229 /DNA_START=328 /DNA_END=2262 /DNA_ORIENTATION=+
MAAKSQKSPTATRRKSKKETESYDQSTGEPTVKRSSSKKRRAQAFPASVNGQDNSQQRATTVSRRRQSFSGAIDQSTLTAWEKQQPTVTERNAASTQKEKRHIRRSSLTHVVSTYSNLGHLLSHLEQPRQPVRQQSVTKLQPQGSGDGKKRRSNSLSHVEMLQQAAGGSNHSGISSIGARSCRISHLTQDQEQKLRDKLYLCAAVQRGFEVCFSTSQSKKKPSSATNKNVGKSSKKRNHAAIMLQRCYRGTQARRIFTSMYDACELLHFPRPMAMNRPVALNLALRVALTIQRYWRGYWERCGVLRRHKRMVRFVQALPPSPSQQAFSIERVLLAKHSSLSRTSASLSSELPALPWPLTAADHRNTMSSSGKGVRRGLTLQSKAVVIRNRWGDQLEEQTPSEASDIESGISSKAFTSQGDQESHCSSQVSSLASRGSITQQWEKMAQRGGEHHSPMRKIKKKSLGGSRDKRSSSTSSSLMPSLLDDDEDDGAADTSPFSLDNFKGLWGNMISNSKKKHQQHPESLKNVMTYGAKNKQDPNRSMPNLSAAAAAESFPFLSAPSVNCSAPGQGHAQLQYMPGFSISNESCAMVHAERATATAPKTFDGGATSIRSGHTSTSMITWESGDENSDSGSLLFLPENEQN